MASQNFTQFDYSLIKKKVSVFACLKFGSTGAVTLEQWNPTTGAGPGAYAAATAAGAQGVKSVVKNGTGDYTVTLQDSYQRLLGVHTRFLNSKSLGEAAPFVSVVTDGTDVTTAGAGTVELLFKGPTAGSPAVWPLVATNPASGEIVLVEFVLDDCSTI